MERLNPHNQLPGALAPLAVAGIYYALIASLPGVPRFELALLTLQYLGIGIVALLVFMAVAFTFCLARRMFVREFGERPWHFASRLLVERWREDRCSSFFMPVLLFALLLPAYTAFKQIVIPTAGFAFDSDLQGWGRTLLFGAPPWQVTHWIFRGPRAALILSEIYHQYFVPMAAVFLIGVLPLRAQARTHYLLAHALIWIVAGTCLAYLMSSSGPAFWQHFHPGPNPYAPLMRELANDNRMLIGSGYPGGLPAYHFQQALEAAFGSRDLHVGLGISAMPSMHVALAVQFACAAFLVRRWLGIVASLYAAFIWLASIYLGWHFALDGIVSLIVTVSVWRVSGDVSERLHARPVPARAAAIPVRVVTGRGLAGRTCLQSPMGTGQGSAPALAETAAGTSGC